jgi:hypothetical protein
VFKLIALAKSRLRRSSASATTPERTEKTMIGTTFTRPTSPSARPLSSSGTSSETCHKTAAFCIIEPVVDKSCPVQSRRKLRWRSAGNASRNAGIGAS